MTRRNIFHTNPWGLTAREARVLIELIEHPRKIAADRMGVTVETIVDHLKNIHARMGVARNTTAVVLFDRWWGNTQAGLTPRAAEALYAEIFQ